MTEKKKVIGFVNSSQSWGGGEKWHYEAARDLHSRGFKVVFFCRPGSAIREKIAKLGIPMVNLTISNLSFLNIVKMLWVTRRLKHRGITTLLINNPADLKLVGPAARMAGIQNIIFRRGVPRPFKRNFYNRWLLRDVIDCAIANSRALADSIDATKIGLVPPEKIVIIENGINFAELAEAEPLIQRDQRIILTTAGRMIHQKNQAFLIGVAAALKKKGFDFRLLIAGSGELEADLRNLVASLNIGTHVEFLGFVEDMPGLFASTDIFVFPSFYEGSPNALIEAAARGLAIVASDIAPIREILPDANLGRLCPVDDTEAFCTAIMELGASATLRDEVGLAAREQIRKRFDLNNCREKLISIL